ncbi:LINE-1 retrotransposable element ORF2 protein [Ananas comosus]|uniref:LINE-1 retrotransposable element ORF2 protein n=1 Tax=Ananas comosus TaxID=4615 RepID=A0A199UW35_ANACO|nr:LINE-1 retrotransposable element ORF2 protein [Ananas comosus]
MDGEFVRREEMNNVDTRLNKLETEISMVEEEGQVYRTEEDKKQHFLRYFKKLYSPNDLAPSTFGDWSGLFDSNRVSDFNLAHLTRPFSVEKIKTGVFQLVRDKAPGPDGFLLSFYQTFWETLKKDIVSIFHEKFDGKLDTGPFDYTFICLVPKREGARRATDFRPISLLNGIHKIISKVLTNRLELVMCDLIGSSQSAFLKGKNITDAFAATYELMGWGNKLGLEGVGIKLDFEKAYDRIYWPFLFNVLEWWGFDDRWCSWIKLCVCSAKVAILVNGDVTNWIKTKRGIRQGDPLSQFLFLLVAECLARMTHKATSNNLFKGLEPSEATKISLIQYANDTFFFCEAKKKYKRNLKFLWQLFEWASGMKINREKFELYYTGKVEGKAARLATVLNCKVGNLPTKYLGLPLADRRPSKEDWLDIIRNIQRKIDGWQAKLLSRYGRLILVNAVLTNLPLYFLSMFKAPKWVIARIEALRRDFFWNGGNNAPGKGCLVAWKNICKSKKKGGLGVLDLDTMNHALLTKWWWKFFSEPHLQWNKLIHDLYYRRRRPLKEGRSFRPSSYWWKGVLGLNKIFKWGALHKLGYGDSIDFWSDRWYGDKTLQSVFPEIYSLSHCKNCKSRVGLEQDWWFTVKSVYSMLNDGGLRDDRSKIWSFRVPLKVKVFTWIVLKKRPLTADNLLKRGWTGNTVCVLCESEEETVDHLFAQCVFSRFLMVMSMENALPGNRVDEVTAEGNTTTTYYYTRTDSLLVDYLGG